VTVRSDGNCEGLVGGGGRQERSASNCLGIIDSRIQTRRKESEGGKQSHQVAKK